MQMTITTRWLDQKNDNFDTVDELLLKEHPDDDTGGTGFSNWSIKKIFSNHKETTFNGRKVQYNYYTYSADRIPSGVSIDEDVTVRISGFVIAYASGGKIRYIIDRNANALQILRKMLFYTGKSEIIKNNLEVSSDLFVWLIRKVYSGENIIESESNMLSDLTINSIRGFKGNTEDLLTKVSASGETVMNIISSLSFLIESQNLNQITLDTSYGKHTNIEVALSNRNTIASSSDRYLGELVQSEKAELHSTMFLLLYTEIMPIIIQKYRSEIEEGQWGVGTCVGFLNQVANDLSEKVSIRINELTSRPAQLEFPLILDDEAENKPIESQEVKPA